ncbi:hypothetical protein ACQEVZ_40105 [Dactylosporangium sp. CA-152071]|uniref:hypothetical protein n=1 Tax=Dactylosporangium sp. CA-152071 TaxID=3239933 RepID=UPI003D90073A
MTVEPQLLNPCPAIRPVPTQRGTVVRRRDMAGDVEPAVVEYARTRPDGRTVWLVLDEDLLSAPPLEQALASYVAGLAPAIRRRVVIDAGALEPPPPAAAALAAAERLRVPVQLPAAAATGVDEDWVEYRDAAGRPTTRQDAATARLLPTAPVRDPHLTLSSAQAHDRHAAALRARAEADAALETAQQALTALDTALTTANNGVAERTRELGERETALQEAISARRQRAGALERAKRESATADDAVRRLAARADDQGRQHREAESSMRAATALEQTAREVLDRVRQQAQRPDDPEVETAQRPDEPEVETAQRRLDETTDEVARHRDHADRLGLDIAATTLERDGLAEKAERAADQLASAEENLRTADDLVTERTGLRDVARSELTGAAAAADEALQRRDEAREHSRSRQDAADRQATEVAAWQRRIDQQADLTGFGDGSLAMLDAGTIDDLSESQVSRLVRTAEQSLADYYQQPHRASAVPPKILDELRERVTLEFVKTELPGMRTATGKALLLGDDDRAVQLRFTAGLRRRPEGAHAELPVRPGDMQSELRYLQEIRGIAQQFAANFRDVPLGYAIAWGMGVLTFLRLILNALTLRMTINQYRRHQATEQRTTQLQIHRLREDQYAHRYTLTWAVTAAEPVLGAPAAIAPATLTDPEPLTVWFPSHIARPPGQVTSVGPPAPLPQQLALAEGFHDPEFLHAELAEHYPQLKSLNPASLRALLRFVGADNLRAGFPKARTGGLLSEPMYDRSGKPVGFLRLELPTVEEYRTVTLQRQGWMEMWRRHYVQERGAAAIHNATELTISAGSTGTHIPYMETIGRAPRLAGGPQLGGGIGGFTTDTLMATGGAGLTGGLSATASHNRPIHISDANLVWLITLVGAPTGTAPLRIDGTATGKPGVRVRHVPLTTTSPVPGLYPPAGVEHGGGSGLADVSGFTLNQPEYSVNGVDDDVENWLKEHKFIAAGPSATDEQLANYRRYLEVVTAEHRETAWDELDGHGIWEPFTRTTLTGVQRIAVRWRVRRVDGQTADSDGVVEDFTVWRAVDRPFAMDMTHQTGDSAHAFLQGDVLPALPVTSVITVPVAVGPYQYTASADRTMHLGGSYERESVVVSPAGGTHHRHVVRFELGAEIRRQGTTSRVFTAPNPQRGTVAVLVPDFRMLTARTRKPEEPGITVASTSVDRLALEQRLRRVTEPPPALTGITDIGGSAALNRLLTRLLEVVFGTGRGPADQASLSAQAVRGFASPARLHAALEQMLRGVYVSDQLFEPGLLSQSEGWLELRALVDTFDYRPNHTGAETNDMYIEDTTTAIGGSASAAGRDRAHRLGGAVAGLFPAGDHWSLSAPTLSGGRTASNRRIRWHWSESSEDRTSTFKGDTYTLHAALTFVAKVRGAPRNVLATPVSLVHDVSTTATGFVTVPDALTVHVSLGTLVKMLAVMRQFAPDATIGTLVDGVPQHVQDRIHNLYLQKVADRDLRAAGRAATGPDVRFLPRWVTARRGLGDATVTDVRPRGGHRALLEAGLREVEAAVPGVTRPGSASFLPGVYQNLTNLVSPAVVRPAAAQWWANSGTTGTVTLASFGFVTTTPLGLVQAEVLLVADATPNPQLRTLFGRVDGDVDLENHGLNAEGRSDTSTSGARWSAGIGIGGAPRGVSARQGAAMPSVTVEWRGARNRGQRDLHESAQRYMQRAADGAARFDDVPLRLGVQVHVSRPDKSIVTGVGPILWKTVSSWFRKDRPTTWTEMSVDLDLLQHDTTIVPHVDGPPPAWLRTATRFEDDPLTITAPSPGPGSGVFTAAEVQQWPQYTEPPAVHRTTVSDAREALTAAALAVLPTAKQATLAEGAVVEYLSGPGSATLHERISTSDGDRRTFPVDSHDPTSLYEEVLTIRPLRATDWAPVTDQLDDGTQAGTPVILGDATKVNLERFTNHTTSTAVTATTNRRWSLAAQISYRAWDRTGVVDPKHGATVGNRHTVSLALPRIAAQSGADHTTTAAGLSQARRAPRLIAEPPGDASGIGPDPAAPAAHRLVYRHVLFEVTGVTRWRRKGSDTWHDGTPRRQWVAATNHIRAHHTVLDPPAAPPTGESMDALDLPDVFGVVGSFAADGSAVTTPDGTTFTHLELRRRHTADAVSPGTGLILVPLDEPGSVTGARRFAEGFARTGTGQVLVPDRPVRVTVRVTAADALAEDANGNRGDWWSVAPDGTSRPLGPSLRAGLRELRMIEVAATAEHGAGEVWRVDGAVRLPGFATLDGRLVVLAAGQLRTGPRRDALREVAERLHHIPLVVLEHIAALPHLYTIVERLRWDGHTPVVFLSPGADADAVQELRQHSVAVVYPRSDGINDRWHVEGPGGQTGRYPKAELDRAVEHAGTLSQAMPAPDRPPPALADWLRSDGWSEARDVYQRHEGALRADDVSDRLDAIGARHPRDTTLAVFRAVLDLARAGHARVAFDYLHEPDPGTRQRQLLRDVRGPGLRRLMAALVRAARWAARRDDSAQDVVLLIATETMLALGRLDLTPDEVETLRCLDRDRRGEWLARRGSIVAAIAELAGPDAAQLTDDVEALARLVVDCTRAAA